MELEINNSYKNFKLIKIEKVKEIDSEVYYFEHEKTKTRLLFLKNNVQEKTFAITFRTPPTDSTGLPHILEHSVLCGSKNYDIKDPFATLAKSTIHSFINAFTFPDKTMYPFSTTNEEEYSKIMDVYLDAVFFPNIYRDKEIFLQEGWRYELKNKEDELKYSGVVYGEMKGAFSSPARILDSQTQRVLFPDTTYGVESGGDPLNIVELKYEEFLDFHTKYYHPSNSTIIMHGDINILKELELINNNFLSKFEELKVDSEIKFQKSFDKIKEKTILYPISKEENKADKYLFSSSLVLSKAVEFEDMLGLDLLGSILMEFESSPLKKALIKAEIAEDIYGGFYEDFINQPIFTITAQNTNIESKSKFSEIINTTLKELKEKGLNRDLIIATINKKEFRLKEQNFYDVGRFPTGLKIALKIQDSWLYDGDPLGHIKYTENLNKIKAEIDNKYFENLIEKYFLNNNHGALVVLEPSHEINITELSDKKLKIIKNNLSEKEIEEIIEQTKGVEKFQNKEDNTDEVNKIKILDTDKISKEPNFNELKLNKINNVKVLELEKNTNGIDYFEFYFNTDKINIKDIQYISILTSILEEIETKNYSSDEFANLINTYTGEFGISKSLFETVKNNFKPNIEISTKILSENFDKLILILNELLNNVLFNEEKIKETIKKLKSRYESSIIESGHAYSAQKINSYLTNTGAYIEETRGIKYFQFLKELNDNYEEEKNNIKKKLEEIYSKIFNEENLTIAYASNTLNIEKLKEIKLLKKENKEEKYEFKLEKLNEAIKTNSQINYVGIGYNFKKLNQEYTGSMQVLRNYLRYNYLWENIRVKGGAYGAIAKFTQTGEFVMVSYRDPNIKRTLEQYRLLSKELENLNLKEDEIRRFIIGTISDYDSPLTIEDELSKATSEYFREITFENRKKERTEIINTKLNDLKKLSPLIENFINENYICVVGSKDIIEKEGEEFTNKINI